MLTQSVPAARDLSALCQRAYASRLPVDNPFFLKKPLLVFIDLVNLAVWEANGASLFEDALIKNSEKAFVPVSSLYVQQVSVAGTQKLCFSISLKGQASIFIDSEKYTSATSFW